MVECDRGFNYLLFMVDFYLSHTIEASCNCPSADDTSYHFYSVEVLNFMSLFAILLLIK